MSQGYEEQKSTRDMLESLRPIHSRALPPLDQIGRSVGRILARWPDSVPSPESHDREKLALDMLSRVADWNWEGITTQKVISAAVAVFDEERRLRSDLAPVRNFYLAEIRTRAPGPFLDGMAGIYLDTFSPQEDHTNLLAEALSQRRKDLGGRYRKMAEIMALLFKPRAAANELARIMLDADDAYAALKSIGFGSPHLPGLVQSAQKTFIEELAPKLETQAARAKLFNWLMPETGPVLQTGAGRAIEALLSVWKHKAPPDELRNELSETIIAAWNDPRLHTGGIWSGFDPELKSMLLRWLTRQDMKFFCDMVTVTQNSHMWPPRRDFWLKLYDDKMIDEAWVAFGSDARRYAQQNLVRSGKTDMTRRFGRQLDRNESTSLLIMRIGNKIVVDGCHSYKTHIFRSDQENAPKLYQPFYYCDKIMRASRASKPHNSIRNWSQWVLQNV